MTLHKHKQFLQFHRSSLLQCDDGRSLLITQDGQQTDWGLQSMHICNLICDVDRLSTSLYAAVKLLKQFPILHRFCLGPSRLTTNFYQTAVWQCFFTTGKHDPVPTTYPHANVYAIPISRGGSMGAKGAVAPVKPPPQKFKIRPSLAKIFRTLALQ